MEAIKQALEQQFEYPNNPLAYKHFKDQVAIVMKSRCIVLKKMIDLIVVLRSIGINCKMC
jgi:hypothetical protein